MLISIFNRGTGAGKGPVDYVTAKVVNAYDPKTGWKIKNEFVIRDPVPVVMAGDPALTRQLIDSSSNKWKYASGVIAFERSDAPTDAEQREVMADYERLAFAGLDKSEFNILWVRHEHCGNVELHFVAPRLHLGTGKAYNPCPPGHEKAHDAFRDAWNHEHGWADPSDPLRARLVKQENHALKIEAAALRAGLVAADDPKRLIGEYLMQQMEAGNIKNRADVLASLEEAGLTISRQGKDYVSVRDGDAKPIRLKGIIYESGFGFEFDRAAALRAEFGIQPNGTAESQDQGRRAGDREPDPGRAAAARERLVDILRNRTEYNQGRYQSAEYFAGRPDLANGLDAQRGSDRATTDSAELERVDDGAGRVRENVVDRGEQLAEGDRERLSQVDGGIAEGSEENLLRSGAKSGLIEENFVDRAGGYGVALPADVCRDLGLLDGGGSVGDGADGQRQLRGDEGRRLDGVRPDGGQKSALPTLWQKLTERLKGVYDRTRAAVVDRFRGAVDAVRRGLEAHSFAHQQLIGAGVGLGAASLQFEQSARTAVTEQRDAQERLSQGVELLEQQTQRTFGKLTMDRADELERFKSQINLVEYAQAQGYQIVKTESSKASTVMRQGDDKIVVATDVDGHGIYFSVRDDADHGTIVDFVQKHQGLNLGQVRQELRPWCDGPVPSSYRPKQDRLPELDRPRRPEPSNADRQQVLAVWMRMEPQPDRGHHYLKNERDLSEKTLKDPRFFSQIRIDSRGNAVFPHFDREGLTGYELKNRDFAGFAKHGEKGIWHSTNLGNAPRVVIVESAIDAMSHAQATKDQEAAYISVGGSMSGKQRDLLAGALTKAHERGAEIVVGTDNDLAGNKLAREITAMAPAGAEVNRDVPKYGKDWNEQVQYQRGDENSYSMSM